MGTITAQQLADQAAGLVHDTSRVRWSDADWLGWLNDAQRETVVLKPDAYTIITPTALATGATLQALPSGGLQLFGVTRNMGADGLTPGRSVNVVARDVMDTTLPNWHTETASGEINNYMYDPRAPKQYYVYPKAPATAWYVEIMYAAIPADVALIGDTLTLDDVYANALLNYMLFRAFGRDEVYGQMNPTATMYYQQFTAGLRGLANNEQSNNPNLTTSEFNVATDASAAKPAG